MPSPGSRARSGPSIPRSARPAGDDGSVDPRIESEILQITGAVSGGRTEEALQRAERLADLLEHPASRTHPHG